MKAFFLKNKKLFLFFALSSLLGILTFLPYLNMHYSLDCYQDLLSNEQYYLASVAGRPLITLYFQILNGINFNVIAHQQLFCILSILIFSLGITLILKKVVNQLKITDFKNMFLPWLIVSGIIWNLFTTEVFQFNSSLPAQALGFLCVSAGFSIWSENLNKKKFILILLLLIISLFFFQSLIAFFVVLVFIWILVFSKNIKKGLINLSFLYLVPLGINYVYIKFFHPLIWGATQGLDRTAGVDYFQNFLSLLRYQKFLWFDSVGLMPSLLYFGLVLGVFILVVFTRKKNKFNLKNIFLILVLTILIALFTGLLPHFLTKNIWISQRSTTIIGAIPFLMLFIIFLNWKELSKKILILITIIYLLLQIFFINRIGTDLLENNRLEQIEAKNIIQTIQDYEKSNSIKVDKIIFSNDKNPTYKYPNLISSMDINARSLTRSWAFKGLMRFEDGTNYEYEQMTDEDKSKIFQNKDFSQKDGNQIATDNSKVFVLIY